MPRVLLLAAIAACNSDSKLHDDPAGGAGPGQTGTGGPTTPSGTTPDTTSPTTGDDPPPGDTAPPTTPDGTDPGAPQPGDSGFDEDAFCQEAATLAGYLDPYQSADDGRVLFCHSGSGSHYNLIETDISSCLPHLSHASDVFPTSGCDT